jgi:hypothetical protein
VTEAMTLAGLPGLESLPPLAPAPALQTDASEPPPAAAAPGQLWLVAAKAGAFVSTGRGWRWVPRCFIDRLLVRTQLSLGGRSPGTVEPVLSWGDGRAFDAVFVRHLAGGRIAFGLAQARDAGALRATGAEGGSSVAGEARAASILLDRVEGRVRVELDGREVLSARADLAPLGRAFTRLGALPPDHTLDLGTR